VGGHPAYECFQYPGVNTVSDLRDEVVLRHLGGYPAHYFMMINSKVFVRDKLDWTIERAGATLPKAVVYVMHKRHLPRHLWPPHQQSG